MFLSINNHKKFLKTLFNAHIRGVLSGKGYLSVHIAVNNYKFTLSIYDDSIALKEHVDTTYTIGNSIYGDSYSVRHNERFEHNGTPEMVVKYVLALKEYLLQNANTLQRNFKKNDLGTDAAPSHSIQESFTILGIGEYVPNVTIKEDEEDEEDEHSPASFREVLHFLGTNKVDRPIIIPKIKRSNPLTVDIELQESTLKPENLTVYIGSLPYKIVPSDEVAPFSKAPEPSIEVELQKQLTSTRHSDFERESSIHDLQYGIKLIQDLHKVFLLKESTLWDLDLAFAAAIAKLKSKRNG